MPVKVNNETYYRTAEVCRIVGISKATFFRWLNEGIFNEAECRDRRGWRLFSGDEVHKFEAEANRIIKIDQSTRMKRAA